MSSEGFPGLRLWNRAGRHSGLVKGCFVICFIVFATFLCTRAPAKDIDPVLDYKAGLTIEAGDQIVKWEVDVNGDGKDEVLLRLRSGFEKDVREHEPPGWMFYIAEPSGSGHKRSTGTEFEPNSLSIDDMPLINPNACFIGQITELGRRGVVTMRVDNPRESESIGKIYAYTIEGDHLKRTELAQYVIVEGPHALFTKYLTDDKRTRVQLTEIAP